MKKIVAVLIPIYKEHPNDDELISLNQCIKILKQHKIIFVAPNNLNCEQYLEVCRDNRVNVERFDDNYFENIAGYNKLMLSSNFYKKFLSFKYILIHQLDAFVFSDELLYWCNQGYDFIGAPHAPHQNKSGEIQFLKNYSKILNTLKINHFISNVGNGGFSLRKTKSFYILLKLLHFSVKKWGLNNEDGFFKYWGNILYPFFKLPKDELAISFAIELDPKKNLKRLKGKLPFGCHAFKKYDWETWKPYIENFND